MPEKKTKRRAAARKRKGQSGSSQAGEYVREEFHHVRSGKHGAKSAKQAIAIGLNKARRAGVKVPKKKGSSSSRSKSSSSHSTKSRKSSGRSKSSSRSHRRGGSRSAHRSRSSSRSRRKSHSR